MKTSTPWSIVDLLDSEASSRDPSHDLNDAMLVVATDPVAEYEAMAKFIVSRIGRGGMVMIVGNHLGVLGNALTSRGVNWHGVDPKNHDHEYPHPGGGTQELLCGSVRTADPFLLCPRKLDFVIVDTTADKEPLDANTARNLALARAYSACAPVILQTRAFPHGEPDAVGLMLPGHNACGYEQYLFMAHTPIPPPDDDDTIIPEGFLEEKR